MRTYRIRHRTTYDYAGEVSAGYGRAHLLPRDRPGQRCREGRVTVDPAPAEQREHTDWFGNRSVYVAVTAPHRRLDVLAESTVEVTARPVPAGGARWEAVRDGLRGALDPAGLDARGYALPSPRLPAHPGVSAYAAPSLVPGRPVAEVALDLTARIHRDFRYVSGSSSVRSTVPELLDRGAGVCQDFAHLGVAALRSAGLAARYVSGYLETVPPPGREKLVGADASHAWVSVWTGTGWLDVDPTNDRVPGESYVVLAHGRDYADVPPLRGVIFSAASGSTMTVAVDMVRVDG
ncbi:MAG: transglutaminase family protein [Pseudonocardiales bacterium]|nr:transglutaminase family protein [Pseudonocardiales bacterium]